MKETVPICYRYGLFLLVIAEAILLYYCGEGWLFFQVAVH